MGKRNAEVNAIKLAKGKSIEMQEQWQEFNNTSRGGDMSWGKERAQKFQSPKFFVKGVPPPPTRGP